MCLPQIWGGNDDGGGRAQIATTTDEPARQLPSTGRVVGVVAEESLRGSKPLWAQGAAPVVVEGPVLSPDQSLKARWLDERGRKYTCLWVA